MKNLKNNVNKKIKPVLYKAGFIFFISITIHMCAMKNSDLRFSAPDVILSSRANAQTVHKATILKFSDDAQLRAKEEILTPVDVVYSSSSQSSVLRKSPKPSPRSSPSGSLILPLSPRKNLKNIKKYCEEVDHYQDLIGQALLVAVKQNSLLKIMDIVHFNPNVSDKEDRTPLIIATQKNNVKMVRELLTLESIDVNKADMWGNTSLHHAVLQGNDDIIKLLLYDYRVNSLIRNKDNNLAKKFINDWCHPNFQSLKLLFFGRSRLDSVVEEEVLALQQMSKQERDDNIDKSILVIQKRIDEDHEKQKKDRELPKMEQSLIINNEFIRSMIIYRLAACMQNIHEPQGIKIIINNNQNCL